MIINYQESNADEGNGKKTFKVKERDDALA